MPDTRGARLEGERLDRWASIATLLEWLPAALDEQLQRDAGLTHFEYGVLFALARAEGGVLRMSVLAGLARGSLSRLSRAVGRMEARGFVTRSVDVTDGRFTLATLTPEGRRKEAEAAPGHAALVDRLVLGPLSEAQQRQLAAISGRITTAIAADARPTTRDIRDLPEPEAGEAVTPVLQAMRLDERY